MPDCATNLFNRIICAYCFLAALAGLFYLMPFFVLHSFKRRLSVEKFSSKSCFLRSGFSWPGFFKAAFGALNRSLRLYTLAFIPFSGRWCIFPFTTRRSFIAIFIPVNWLPSSPRFDVGPNFSVLWPAVCCIKSAVFPDRSARVGLLLNCFFW